MSILLPLPEVWVFRFHVDFRQMYLLIAITKLGMNHCLQSPLTEGSSDGHPGRWNRPLVDRREGRMTSVGKSHKSMGFSGTPNVGTPLPILFPAHHKGVPFLGVPEITPLNRSCVNALKRMFTPRKFNSSPLKNNGWKTILSYWGPVTFQGQVLEFVSDVFLMVNLHQTHIWMLLISFSKHWTSKSKSKSQ